MNQFNGQNRGLMFAVYTALLWAFLAILLKVAVVWVDSFTIVWLRFSIAFVFLFLWMIFTGEKSFKIFIRPPILIFVTAFFLAMNYYGFMVGVEHTSPSNAQVFIQLAPVGFAMVGIFIYHEKVNWKSIVGFMIVLCGFLMFFINQLSELKGFEWEYKKGILMVIFGALCWVVFASLQKKLVINWDANQLNLFIYAFCSLLLLPFAEISSLAHLSFGQWILMISLGLNTVLSYGFLALAIKFADANRVSVILALNPVITFISMAIFGAAGVSWIAPEKFNFYSIVGALVVVAGAVITILSRDKKQG